MANESKNKVQTILWNLTEGKVKWDDLSQLDRSSVLQRWRGRHMKWVRLPENADTETWLILEGEKRAQFIIGKPADYLYELYEPPPRRSKLSETTSPRRSAPKPKSKSPEPTEILEKVVWQGLAHGGVYFHLAMAEKEVGLGFTTQTEKTFELAVGQVSSAGTFNAPTKTWSFDFGTPASEIFKQLSGMLAELEGAEG